MPLHDDDDLSNVIYPERLKELLKEAYEAGWNEGGDKVAMMEGLVEVWVLPYSDFEEWYEQKQTKC